MSDSDNDSYVMVDSPRMHNEQHIYVSVAVKQHRHISTRKQKSRVVSFDCRDSTWETDDDDVWLYDESDKRDETICARPQKHYKQRFNRVKHIERMQTSYMSSALIRKRLQKKKKAKQCTKERIRMRDAKQLDQAVSTEPVNDPETITHRHECVGYIRAFDAHAACSEKKRNDMIDMIESKPHKWFKQRMNRPRRSDHKLMRRTQHCDETHKRRLAIKKKTIGRASDRRIKYETDIQCEYSDIIWYKYTISTRCNCPSCVQFYASIQ